METSYAYSEHCRGIRSRDADLLSQVAQASVTGAAESGSQDAGRIEVFRTIAKGKT